MQLSRGNTLLFIIFLCFVSSSGAIAADCTSLKMNIKQEKKLTKLKLLYLDAVLKCPENADLRYGYGTTLERLRRYKEALHEFHIAIRLMPEMAEAYFSMADIYRHQEKDSEAVLFYEKGLLLQPDKKRALSRLKQLQDKQGGKTVP